jgi:flagellar protein FlgJ
LAISPPSDIVLDVARAAEPSGVQAARAELAKRGGRVATGASFSMGETQQSGRAAEPPASPNSFKRFEAMVLQTFIQNMMPQDAEAVYGKGIAGDMWKSMMAEKIAGVMADRGGIGIADRMLPDHYASGDKRVAVGPVKHASAHTETDEQTSLSQALVQDIQRKIARSITEERSGIAATTKK